MRERGWEDGKSHLHAHIWTLECWQKSHNWEDSRQNKRMVTNLHGPLLLAKMTLSPSLTSLLLRPLPLRSQSSLPLYREEIYSVKKAVNRLISTTNSTNVPGSDPCSPHLGYSGDNVLAHARYSSACVYRDGRQAPWRPECGCGLVGLSTHTFL